MMEATTRAIAANEQIRNKRRKSTPQAPSRPSFNKRAPFGKSKAAKEAKAGELGAYK